MIPRPSRRLLLILLAGALPATLAVVSPVFAALALAVDVAALALFFLDAGLARRREGEVVVRRSVPARLSRRKAFVSTLELHNTSERPVSIRVVERLPESFEPREREVRQELEPGAHVQVEARVVPALRGSFEVAAPVAERATPLGLGVVRVPSEGAVRVSVLPETRALGQFDALVRQRRLHEMGVGRVRERGEGTEIAGLRPYSLGDPFARVDWKATARRAELVSREMHSERRQNVVLMLDCGRRMAREADGRSRLDYAVEAALLLAHVAFRSDDRVGLVAFADRMLRVVPPVRAHGGAKALTQAMFELEPVLREPPYERVAARVSQHFRRRSLIVFFTDAIEPTSLESLARPVRFLSKRHLVLCVVFQDPSIERALAASGEDVDGFYRAGAASELALERERGLRMLRDSGALLLESPTDKLSTNVINRYLQVKARRML